jgi:formylglycine-generating enzyme required for sulfatase activity
MENGILQDETLVNIPAGTPRLISQSVNPTVQSAKPPEGMVDIPAGTFVFHESHGDEFIPYPKQFVDSSFNMKGFYMDKFPVTNRQFKKFLDATHYHPADTTNFLKHWPNKKIRAGEEDFPVIYVSYEDAGAYAKWAGKRLPTELEWQYAAQTSEGNEWPWKQSMPVRRKEEVVTETLTVTSIEGIDSTLCNLGNGKLYKVGSYPAGANPHGLQDLVGCVWQLTNDVYMNGSYQYIILKGGSYFKPSSSWWYVQSGPRELHYRQFLLRVSPGFERNGTVGFRCVK